MSANGQDKEIDEGYVIGAEGMRRMGSANVLISGLSGPGLEVAKNIILAGVRSVTLHDYNKIEWEDLSSCFYAEKSDIGKSRACVVKDKLAELNHHVLVDILNVEELSTDVISKYSVVVLSQASHDSCIRIGDMCHEHSIKFVACKTHGLFGNVFCDFGQEFVVVDPTGQDPPSVMIQQIEQVGAGAIGCELLKNFALMGVSAGPTGKLIITDMDSIERSNLNRQFLFRPSDINKMKSTVAALAAKRMNPEMNIEAQENRVGPETEIVYTDEFFEALDGVANALDNIEARTYMDRRCVYYCKSLLESGTLGTRCNVQVVIPHQTESYSSSHDPPEKSFPVCTLKNFPYQIEHTLQWARDLFEGIFVQVSQNLDSFVRIPESQSVEILESVATIVTKKRPKNFEDCVQWARLFWQELYHDTIAQLLFNFPPDHVTSNGAPFWSGTKRCPHSLEFNFDQQSHLDFVVAGANLRAKIFSIPQCRNLTKIIPMIKAVIIPPFEPKKGVKIDVTDAEAKARESQFTADNSRLSSLRQNLLSITDPNLAVNIIEFEKDDDTNFHMDFITAASNSRAECYSITPADRLKSKLIAGRILPAIATTTSLVSGLVCLEFYKLIQGHKKLELYKNAFIDLAQPFMSFFEPLAPPKSTYCGIEFTLWDKFEFTGPMTLKELIDHFMKEHKLEVSMISQDVRLLYAPFLQPAKMKERLSMTIEKVVEMIVKSPLPSHVAALVLDVTCQDADGEDVDVPYIRYKLGPVKQAA